MTSKERMLTAIRNKQADMVPVSPDISNMIPCRLTGLPYWDIYLYQKIPLWKAYIHAADHFHFDGWLPRVPVEFDFECDERSARPAWKEAVVRRSDERIYTRKHALVDGKECWQDVASIYYIDNPPNEQVALDVAELPAGTPSWYEDVELQSSYNGLAAYHEAKKLMGDKGIVGIGISLPGLSVTDTKGIYEYYDDKEAVVMRCKQQHESIIRRARAIIAEKPDVLSFANSGHMIANPEPIFRDLSLVTLREVTDMAKAADIPTVLHCCGPEYDLVKIAAQESDLSLLNPLEMSPMGDCDLATVKKEFGKQIAFMGNIPTTSVMLLGSVADVKNACRKAIDDAADGGGFILSTGDQCGRDTPFANIEAMVTTARTYGKY